MKVRAWFGAIVVTLIFDWAALYGRPSEPPAALDSPASVVLAVDTGSSMRFELHDLRAGLREFIRALGTHDRAQMCSFGGVLRCAPFTRDRRTLLGEVAEIQYHQDARMFDSIDEALDALREARGRRIIVVFTMVPDFRWSVSPKRVLADARAAGVSVYAVNLEVRYFDGDAFVDGQPDPELDRLVRETGGDYVEVDEARDLPSAFSRIAKELR